MTKAVAWGCGVSFWNICEDCGSGPYHRPREDLCPQPLRTQFLVCPNRADDPCCHLGQVDTNYSQVNATVAAHKEGYLALAKAGADVSICLAPGLHANVLWDQVIAVQEGRGCAKGSYWWPHEVDSPIHAVDNVLLDIVRFLDPSVPSNATFGQQFSASNRDLFSAFADGDSPLPSDSTQPCHSSTLSWKTCL